MSLTKQGIACPDLAAYLDNLLQCADYKDASYNGLQVQGRSRIRKVATSADASLRAIKAAVQWGADALIVHHGLFWRGADPRVVGALQGRLHTALLSELNIFAYHLPLDAQPDFGNNAYLCSVLGNQERSYVVPGDKNSIAMRARLAEPLSVSAVAQRLSQVFGNRVEVLGATDLRHQLSDFAVCSGSGSFLIDQDPLPWCEALITGEVNEQTYQLSRELGIVVFALGHHASEQDGVRLLGERVAQDLGLEVQHFTYAQERESCWYDADAGK